MKLEISQGTKLKGKNRWLDATYQGNIGDVHFVVDEEGTAFIRSTQELQERYELPKEQWVPAIWGKYWTIVTAEEDGVMWFIWAGSAWDKQVLANGFVYKTREEALEAAKRARGDV